MKLLVLTLTCTAVGVLSQPFSPASGDGVCPDSDIEFTCVGNSISVSTTRWMITSDGGGDPVCTVQHNIPDEMQTCGPGGVFTSSLTGQTELNYTSSLRAEDVPLSLNGTRVECVDGADLQIVGSANICIAVLQESSTIQDLTVIIEEDMCLLTLEWSEAIVSCDGINVNYSLTVIEDGTEVDVYSGAENRYAYTVNGSVGLQYNFSLTTESCGSQNITVSGVDLSAVSSGNESTYYYLYDLTSSLARLQIVGVNVTWPRFNVLGTDAVYRVIIDPPGEVVASVTGDNCNGETCYHSNTLTDTSTVTVDVVGCTITRLDSKNISTFCPPEDLLVSNVSWNETPVIQNGEGVYSFSGGNVTYNGVSLGSTATYRTTMNYHINGSRVFESRCEDGLWTPTAVIQSAECSLDDLLTCSSRTNIDDETLCCAVNGQTSICVTVTGVSIGSVATYSTSNNYCIDTLTNRTCTNDRMWSGTAPNATEARMRLNNKLSDWNIGLIAVGAILFVGGVSFAVVLLFLRIKASLKVRWWYWILVMVATIITLISLILWIILAVYVSNNDFVEGADSGKWRQDNSLCRDSASNRVKDGLDIGSFLSSLLIPIAWFILMTGGLAHPSKDKKDPEGDEEDGYGMERMDEKDVYDLPSHAKPASPQPLLSAQEGSGYGKLHQADDDPEHYGKLNHPNKKKTASVAPAASAASDGSEYGKLDRSQIPEEPGHYGKLDHSGKKKTATLHIDNSEYGKLDRSQKHGDSGHYGKLDHPVGKKKTATLPVDSSEYGKLDRSQMDESSQQYGKLDQSTMAPTALPPGAPGAGYGKLDRQMQVKSGGGGDVYDEVTNAPRHVPSTKRKPPDH